MPFWSFTRLNSEITESNVRNIPHISDLCKPLSFSRCGFLKRKRLNCSQLFAVGKRHLNASLTEANKRHILPLPVFSNFNHTYNSIKLWLKCQAQIT